MQGSSVNTVVVPALGTKPATLIYAASHPMRVVVRNVGGVVVFLAHDSVPLQDVDVGAATYRLPVGESEVFVLAPKQGLLAAAGGAGGRLSIAISEAIPLRLES